MLNVKQRRNIEKEICLKKHQQIIFAETSIEHRHYFQKVIGNFKRIYKPVDKDQPNEDLETGGLLFTVFFLCMSKWDL